MKRGAGILLINPLHRAALLLLRSRSVAHPGVWSFPGGVQDPGDGTPWLTAQREFTEETGLRAPRDFAGYHVQRSPGREYYTFICYDPRPNLRRPTLNAENDDWKWVRHHETRSLPLYSRFAAVLARLPY